MDLNQLFRNQQIALMNADAAACPSARLAHAARATLYGDRIIAYRAASATAEAGSIEGLAAL